MLVSVGLLVITTLPPRPTKTRNLPVAFLQADASWADSMVNSLSIEAKLNQLLLLRVSGEVNSDSMGSLLQRFSPGGLVLSEYNREDLTQQIGLAQQRSPFPLLVGMALGSYQSGLLQLPLGLGTGAITDDSLLALAGDLLAQQAQALGVQMMMLPSLSDGYPEDQMRTLPRKVRLLTERLQSQQVMACQGPVYPFLPVMSDTSQLDSLLSPYRDLLAVGPSSWYLGARPEPRYRGFPDPLSALRTGQLPYDGLVIGEAPSQSRDMTGSLRQLLQQGVELISLTPAQLPAVSQGLLQLYRNDELTRARIDQQVRRLLLAKTWTGARQRPQPDTLFLRDDMWAETVEMQQFELYAQSLGVVRDPQGTIPLGSLQGLAPHLLTLGAPLPLLLDQLRAYGPASQSVIAVPTLDTLPALPVDKLRRFDPVILALTDASPSQLAGEAFRASLAALAAKTSVILVNLGDAHRLSRWSPSVGLVQAYSQDSLTQRLVGQLLMGGLPSQAQLPLALEDHLPFGLGQMRPVTRLSYGPPQRVGFDPQRLRQIDTIVWSAMDDFAIPGCQVLVARRGQVVWQRAYGHHTYARRRAVDPTDLYDLASMTKVVGTTLAAMLMVDQGKLHLDDSLKTFFRDRYVWVDTARRRDTMLVVLTSTTPSQDSMLAQIDSLSEPMIQDEATPIQLPVIRVSQTRGQERPPDRIDTLYLTPDSLQIVRTWSLGRQRVRSRVFDVSLAELLTHHSGLSAALPVFPFLSYRRRGAPRFGRYFQARTDSLYQVEVANHFYLRRDFLDSIWQATKRMSVAPDKGYMYSDANMILVQRAIDSVNGFGLDSFLAQQFYQPLGMQQTGYRPLRWADEDRIVPTENDQRWRYQLLRGYVHDETAALLGGVSGNAGIFANAGDLGHLFQMLLNGGTYGGRRYLRARTVAAFTRRQAGHRGFGFDLPPSQGAYIIGSLASNASYGHLGYTGTCVWVDPESELIYLFLSNRVHPTNRWRLNELKVRERIHDAIYQAMRDQPSASS
jgi:CubicO group peptidase (beta-lactamase class C family)